LRNSFVFKEKNEHDDGIELKRFIHAPFTMDPYVYPTIFFQQAISLVPIFNVLVLKQKDFLTKKMSLLFSLPI